MVVVVMAVVVVVLVYRKSRVGQVLNICKEECRRCCYSRVNDKNDWVILRPWGCCGVAVIPV